MTKAQMWGVRLLFAMAELMIRSAKIDTSFTNAVHELKKDLRDVMKP